MMHILITNALIYEYYEMVCISDEFFNFSHLEGPLRNMISAATRLKNIQPHKIQLTPLPCVPSGWAVRVHPVCLLLHLVSLILVEWRQVPGPGSADAGVPLDH